MIYSTLKPMHKKVDSGEAVEGSAALMCYWLPYSQEQGRDLCSLSPHTNIK